MSQLVVQFEIGCRDRARTADFVSKLFDWDPRHETAADYIGTGGDVGGHITALGHEPHNKLRTRSASTMCRPISTRRFAGRKGVVAGHHNSVRPVFIVCRLGRQHHRIIQRQPEAAWMIAGRSILCSGAC